MNEPDRREPANTESTPATPGWVESELDEALAGLPDRPATRSAQASYLDCLAASAGPDDAALRRDRCRRALLQALEADGIALGELEQRLERLEADLAART